MSVPYKRGGKWVGGIDVSGKRHWVGTFATKAEWEDAAAQLRVELQRKAEFSEETMTIAEFVGLGWPRTHPTSKRRKESSSERLELSIRRLVKDFGDRRLRGGITRTEARQWAMKTSLTAVSTARQMYNDAIDDDLAEGNPFAGLGIETGPGRRHIQVISNEEFENLVKIAGSTRADPFRKVLSAFVLWQGTVGTRPGEAWALKFEDLDPAGLSAQIERSVDKQGRVDLPKTGRTRTVMVPKSTMQAVQAIPRISDELVFPNTTGEFMRAPAWAWHWHPIRSAFTASLPEDHWLRKRIQEQAASGHKGPGELTIYEMRHRAATWMSEAPPHGLDLDPPAVAAQLGHLDGGALVTQLYRHMDTQRALGRVAKAFEEASDE